MDACREWACDGASDAACDDARDSACDKSMPFDSPPRLPVRSTWPRAFQRSGRDQHTLGIQRMQLHHAAYRISCDAIALDVMPSHSG
eukprot:2459872-Rhodomonas_salina.1